MKTLIKTSGLIFLFISLLSCSIQQPISSKQPDNNESYQVEYLFEHDGCKVYRFLDSGNYVYFTNCNSDVTSITNDSIQTRVVNHVKAKLSE